MPPALGEDLLRFDKKPPPPKAPIQPLIQDGDRFDGGSGPTRFAVIGDPGTGNHVQKAITRQMGKVFQEKPFSSVLVLGDNVYDTGYPALFNRRIYQPNKRLLKQGVRFLPVLGNHDVWKGYGEKQLNYWGVPKTGFYRFSIGPVDFFALDTLVMVPGIYGCHTQNKKQARRISRQQMRWLKQSLKNSKARFKVVYGHYPLVTDVRGRKDVAAMVRRKLLPVLEKHGVDLYLAGHDHFYHRSKLVNGLTQIISGAAGWLMDLPAKRAKTTQHAVAENHFLLFQVNQNRLSFQAISKAGKVIDAGEIRKPEAKVKSSQL